MLDIALETTFSIAFVSSWIDSRDAFINWTGDKFSYPIVPAEFEEFYAANDVRRLALKDNLGELFGYGELTKFNLNENTLYFSRIIIHPNWRKRGLGRILVNKMIEWSVRYLHVEKIRLRVFESNKRAINLYTSLGFVLVPGSEYYVNYDASSKTGFEMSLTLI